MNITQARQKLEQEKGKYAQVDYSLRVAQSNFLRTQDRQAHIEQATVIMQETVQETQGALAFHISTPVTLAIETVFPDNPYEFVVEFVQRRGRTEADILLKRGEARVDPDDAVGGGVVQVAALALRVALWKLGRKGRPVMLLDEPVHFLHSRTYHARVAELLAQVSSELGIQVIMVTGEEDSAELLERADRIFWVEKTGQVAKVTVEDSEGS